MAYRYMVMDGAKSINPFDLDSTRGWTVSGGEQGEATYFNRVPWLYRGVQDRAANVSTMPFTITRGGKPVDLTKDSNVAFLHNMGRYLKKIEQSLVMTGKAFLFLETNPAGYIKSMKYCAPGSIAEEFDKATGEVTGYTRTLKNGQQLTVAKANIVAIYDQDYNTEEGPSNSSAAKAALAACGVLFNTDQFVAQFFARGAIKATILGVDGGGQAEAERFQRWWDDVIGGVKNAWTALVVRFNQVKPVVIGSGVEDLQNDSLTASKRQDIATALGIPESRLWSAAANYATANEDTKTYYRSTIIPECALIAEALTEQVFIKEHKLDGYSFDFQPDTLDMFQVDAGEQALAASTFLDLLGKCPTAELMEATCTTYGIELSDEMKGAITAYYADKAANREKIQEQLTTPTPPEDKPEDAPDAEDMPDAEADPKEIRSALSLWKRKAIHAIERKEPAMVDFKSSAIPLSLHGAIMGQLEYAFTKDDVIRIFGKPAAWRAYP